MNVAVQKWGNSLAIRLPHETVKRFALERGTHVVFLSRKNDIILTPARRKTYRLKNLVSGITKKNTHGEIWPGSKPAGNEAW